MRLTNNGGLYWQLSQLQFEKLEKPVGLWLLNLVDKYWDQIIVYNINSVHWVNILKNNRNSPRDRKSTRLNSSHVRMSYAVFCVKNKKGTAYLRRRVRAAVDDRLAPPWRSRDLCRPRARVRRRARRRGAVVAARAGLRARRVPRG